ncbi:MAG: YtpR family tRNA-binding protein [Metamycoplasmataceae bacterium]
MSISLLTENKIFDNKSNLIIIFSASSGEINFKTKEDFVFIYEGDDLVGINIFNYKKYYKDIKLGYHNFSNENFSKIVSKFSEEMKSAKNNSFFRIGIINEIKNHPQNNNLKILSVETRDEKNITIITNVPNLVPGNKHLFAINKAVLGNGMIIRESKIMGILSQGMICSWKSIGINKEGIIMIQDQSIDEEFDF